ncbi:ABC transporter substrate-binding protein [Aliiroseovarius sp.]|uniref:ABC transporter substrate-binding protein n=1 Tax=Aliiroseovarius sp. TaxID=1872442 RepID=UPI00262AC199|nr:ABC transporter substrate-binding protein [Aliiroseovarius sp.]
MSKELDYLASRVIQRKMNRRSFLGRASALGLSATAAGTFLSNAAHAAEPVKGGTIKVALSGGSATDSLDPALSTNTTMSSITRLWGQPLLELGETGGLDPIIAEEFSSSPDARVWTFKIRKGISFSNGQPLTAEDVLATMERHAGEESKSGALGLLRGIKDMRVEDGAFVVELDGPNADLPYLLTDYHLMIQPNGGKDNPTAAIGTGPYVIKDHEAGVRTVFERNPHAWLDTMGHADTIEILAINDDTARMSAIQSGQVHIANRVPPKIAGLISRAPGVEVRSTAGPGHYVFIMHANTAPFDNKDLRMALKYGINRQEMVDKILFGYGSVGNDTPINASYPLFTPTEQREYDPEKAAAFFKASGHEGPILLRTSDNSFPGAPDASALFQQSLKGAGIDLEIKREPNDGYWSEVWNNKPFSTSYWSGRATQDAMFSTAYLSTADWNDTRFFNEQFDQLLFAARAELNEATRTQMYADMSTILRDEGGLIGPMFNDFIDATSDKVAGWRDTKGFDVMNNYAPAKMWLVG